MSIDPKHSPGNPPEEGRREPCPEAMRLAAYADGRATDDERTAVETHLAGCRDCLDALLDLRAIEAGPIKAAPTAVVRAARALVRGDAARPATPRLRITDWLVRGRWGLSAAATIVACVGGHWLGVSSFEAGARASIVLVDEMSFGAFDPLDDLDLALLASTNGEASP